MKNSTKAGEQENENFDDQGYWGPEVGRTVLVAK